MRRRRSEGHRWSRRCRRPPTAGNDDCSGKARTGRDVGDDKARRGEGVVGKVNGPALAAATAYAACPICSPGPEALRGATVAQSIWGRYRAVDSLSLIAT
jgi:hypothetical protein